MSDRRTSLRIRPEQVPLAPPGDTWAVHRTAIDVALAFERSMASAARTKDRESRLRRLKDSAPPEEPKGDSPT